MAIGKYRILDRARSIKIRNGTEGNAIVNVRHASSRNLVVSFFVAAGQYVSFDRLPDGVYRTQWAFGGLLGDDCATFAEPIGAGEFDGTDDMHDLEWISFTLYPVRNGNAPSHPISMSEFYAK